MYYPDLTPYDYGYMEYENVLNVGWLEAGQTWPTGHFAGKEQVLNKLKSMKRENLCRGWHECDACLEYEYRTGQKLTSENRVGNGELIVKYNEKVYSAPYLVIHYIEEHNYLPPEEFIDALLNS